MHRGGSPAPALAPALGGGGDIVVAYPAGQAQAGGGPDSHHQQGLVPKPGIGMGALPNLIYYAGVARGTVFLAEHSNTEPAAGAGSATTGTDTDTATAAAASASAASAASAARAACVATLERVAALHSCYTFTARGRTLTCLMDDGFAFCALADEALPASDAAKLLAAVRDAFWKLLEWRGLPPDAAGLAPHSLDGEFGPFLRRMVAHYVGVPVPVPVPQPEPEPEQQPEEGAARDAGAGAGPSTASSSSSGVVSPPQSPPSLETTALTGPPPSVPPPLSGKAKKKKEKRAGAVAVPCGPLSPLRKPDKRNKVKDHHSHGHHHHVVTQSREIVFDHHHPPYPPQQQQQQAPGGDMAALEVVVAGPSGDGPNGHAAAAAAARAAAKGGYHHQMAQRTWWRNVRIVLVLDALVCVILFSVWLGICNGFHCLKDRQA